MSAHLFLASIPLAQEFSVSMQQTAGVREFQVTPRTDSRDFIATWFYEDGVSDGVKFGPMELADFDGLQKDVHRIIKGMIWARENPID